MSRYGGPEGCTCDPSPRASDGSENGMCSVCEDAGYYADLDAKNEAHADSEASSCQTREEPNRYFAGSDREDAIPELARLGEEARQSNSATSGKEGA